MNEIRFWRAVFSILALAVAVVFLFHIWGVLLPFLLGLVIAYLVHPVLDRFVALGLRRDRTVIVIYGTFLALAALVFILLLPAIYREMSRAASDMPQYATALNTLIERINADGQRLLHHLVGSRAKAFHLPFTADEFMERLVSHLPENLWSFAHFGLWIFIIPFVAFFALREAQLWIDRLFDWTPSEHVESLLGFLAEINATLGGYMRGQLLDALCVGLLTMAGLWLIGVDGAAMLGVLTGLCNIVPFLAPIVGGGSALLLAYFQGLHAPALVAVFLLFLLVRLLDDFIFVPIIVGRSVQLHPVAMLFAVLAGYEVAGFVGLLFAVPVAAVVKVTVATAFTRRRTTVVLQQHPMS